MGLFSGKKTITVSSTLYNMAGPEEDRPDYLKGTLFAAVMDDAPSLSESITNGYFGGPGMKQRHFFKYADRQNLAGMPTAAITNNDPINAADVQPHIVVDSSPAGLIAQVTNAYSVVGDPDMFLRRWMANNHQDKLTSDWLGDYDKSSGVFTVQFEDDTVETFTDNQFSVNGRYIVANYFQTLDTSEQPIVEGIPYEETPTLSADSVRFPEVSNTPAFNPVSLTRIHNINRSWSDGRPEVDLVENHQVAANLDRTVSVREGEVFDSRVGYEMRGVFHRYTITGADNVGGGFSNTVVTTEDIGGGVILTTTTVITGDQVIPRFSVKHDTQDIAKGSTIGGEKVFIYTRGSGNAALDSLVREADASGFQEFYPFLPIRIDNRSIKHSQYQNSGLYEETKRAYRRATDGKLLDKVVDAVEDNESIDDIDYAYIIYGCSLNVKDHSARKYIGAFMEELTQFQNSDTDSIQNFRNSIDTYYDMIAARNAWQNAVDNMNENDPWADIPPEPPKPYLKPPPRSGIRLVTNSGKMGNDPFDIRMNWTHIDVEQRSGRFRMPEENNRYARTNDAKIEKGAGISWNEERGTREFTTGGIIESFILEPQHMSEISIYIQIDPNTYKKITVYGLQHQNYIYGGKSVDITAGEALDDNDISGFIVPLHYPTLRKMNIVDYTQIATANTHILFNSYEVTKQKWYETWIFKILIIIVILVVAVVIAPAAFAGGAGVLGGHAAVGTALGLTGTAALVAGVVANYIASIVISQLISVVSTAIFGEKWGAIIAAIATFAVGGGFSGGFSVGNILNFASALANGYAGFTAASIKEDYEDLEDKRDAYEERMDYIEGLIRGLGGNDLNFDPLRLTSSVYGNDGNQSTGYLPETADEFIQRTTMTGSDILEISQSMVYDFVEIQQTLPEN